MIDLYALRHAIAQEFVRQLVRKVIFEAPQPYTDPAGNPPAPGENAFALIERIEVSK